LFGIVDREILLKTFAEFALSIFLAFKTLACRDLFALAE